MDACCDNAVVDRRARLNDCRLYFISDAEPGGRPLLDVLAPALAGGVDIFQLRCKHAPDAELLRNAQLAREACDEAGALFILNDRPDLVAQAGADGVHVGQEDAAIADARAVIGDDYLIGVSTHAPDQLRKAIDGFADYAGVGPVHETPTKPGRPAVGLDYVRRAAAHATVPFFAIGGIDATTAAAVIDAGATRVAVVRAIAHAEEPERAALELRELVETGALRGAA